MNFIKKINTSMEDFEVHENDFFRVFYFTQKSPARSDENEDSLFIFEDNNSLILAVADGLGGYADGQIGSKTAVEVLEKNLKKNKTTPKNIGDYREAILNSFDETNLTLLSLKPTPSTTLSVAEVFEDSFRTYFSGDSEVFQIGSGGKLKFKTIPHNPTGLGEESGLITTKEAFESSEKHLITNFLGSNDSRTEIGPISKLDPRDAILLSSDGLTHNLRVSEICEIIKDFNNDLIIEKLKKLTKKRMREENELFKEDDLTIILVLRK